MLQGSKTRVVWCLRASGGWWLGSRRGWRFVLFVVLSFLFVIRVFVHLARFGAILGIGIGVKVFDLSLKGVGSDDLQQMRVAEAGAEISEITLPALQDFSACGQIILAAEAYAVHEQWLKERPQDYGARARERLLAGAELRAVEYLQAVRWRLQLRDQVAAAFANIDVAITASSMDPACRVDDDAALAANYWRQARMPFNVTGQPGLVIPAGFSKGRLPLSLQLVGRPFTEPMLYRVAQFYEDATGWTKHHPAGLAD